MNTLAFQGSLSLWKTPPFLGIIFLLRYILLTYTHHTKTWSRFDQTTVIRLRTGHCGHCGLRAHLKLIGVADSPHCDCKTAEHTVQHMLQDCPYGVCREDRHGRRRCPAPSSCGERRKICAAASSSSWQHLIWESDTADGMQKKESEMRCLFGRRHWFWPRYCPLSSNSSSQQVSETGRQDWVRMWKWRTVFSAGIIFIVVKPQIFLSSSLTNCWKFHNLFLCGQHYILFTLNASNFNNAHSVVNMVCFFSWVFQSLLLPTLCATCFF